MKLFKILSYPFVLIGFIGVAIIGCICAAYDELFILPKYLKR